MKCLVAPPKGRSYLQFRFYDILTRLLCESTKFFGFHNFFLIIWAYFIFLRIGVNLPPKIEMSCSAPEGTAVICNWVFMMYQFVYCVNQVSLLFFMSSFKIILAYLFSGYKLWWPLKNRKKLTFLAIKSQIWTKFPFYYIVNLELYALFLFPFIWAFLTILWLF